MPLSQIAWEIVQELFQKMFGNDFRLNVSNIMMGKCRKKGIGGDDKKFFLCVNAQLVSLLGSLYYKCARIDQERMIRMMNYAIEWLLLSICQPKALYLKPTENLTEYWKLLPYESPRTKNTTYI